MSRSIAESISKLSETLANCKTNLKEKEVADVDNIKISDVDEKIAEIEAGGGDLSTFLEDQILVRVEVVINYITSYPVDSEDYQLKSRETQKQYKAIYSKKTGDDGEFGSCFECYFSIPIEDYNSENKHYYDYDGGYQFISNNGHAYKVGFTSFKFNGNEIDFTNFNEAINEGNTFTIEGDVYHSPYIIFMKWDESSKSFKGERIDESSLPATLTVSSYHDFIIVGTTPEVIVSHFGQIPYVI